MSLWESKSKLAETEREMALEIEKVIAELEKQNFEKVKDLIDHCRTQDVEEFSLGRLKFKLRPSAPVYEVRQPSPQELEAKSRREEEEYLEDLRVTDPLKYEQEMISNHNAADRIV